MVKTRAKTNTEGPRGLNYNPSNIIQRVGDEQDNLAIRGGEFLDRDGVVGATIESTGMIGTSMDVMAKSGNFSAEQTAILENNVNEGAYWGNVTDVIEVYSAAAAAFKNREPADLAQLTLSVGRFATGVVDTLNTVNADSIINESLNEVVGGLLPGVKSGLGAFKNAIDGYQVYQKLSATSELLEQNDTLNEKDEELINHYKSAIKWKLGEISFDFVLNVAETAAMVNPIVQASIMALHGTVNVIKNGVKSYIKYLEKKEKRSVDRIGDIDVEILKSEKIEEKSERFGFKEALLSYSRLKKLEEEPALNEIKINTERKNLNYLLGIINARKLDNDIVSINNLETFLSMEKSTIKSIHQQVIEEKSLKQRFFLLFHNPQKEDIINNLISQGTFPFNDIELADISTLNPLDSDYFFNKTQMAIKTASNRKHISTKERLDRLGKLLLSKQSDQKLKQFMITKYIGKGVFIENPPPGDPEPIRFTKSVSKFKSEIDIS